MTSQISSIWGKKSSHQMIVPPEQQESMKRFLTPVRGPANKDLNVYNTISNNVQSIQRLRNDESKEMIGNFRTLNNQSNGSA